MKLDNYKFIQIKVDHETDTEVTFHIHKQSFKCDRFGGRALRKDLHRDYNYTLTRDCAYSDECSTWMLASVCQPEARIESRTLFCRGTSTADDNNRLSLSKEEFDEVMKIVDSYNKYYSIEKLKDFKGNKVFCRTKRQNIINMDLNNELRNQTFDCICTELEDFTE
jgi:hypothetical protein